MDIKEEVFIIADLTIVSSAIRNLLINAIKFSYRGGDIKISIKIMGSNAVIVISDEGIGIPDNMKDKIFNISEKTGRLGTENELSSGVGLSLIKELVTKNNGNLWFQIEPNQGTTFYISYPLAT